MKTPAKTRWQTFWREWARPFLAVLVITCSIRSAIADWNDVPTGSMKPTIVEGDRVFVNKLAYDLKVPFTTWHLAEWSQPQRGDIVVFFSPQDGMRLVKRVVGLPGDRIELVRNQLFVNGRPALQEPPLAAAVNAIPAAEQPYHLFADERLPEHPHAMMLTPSLASLDTFAPLVVPPGHYFMMGDNRDNSLDSRYFGPVARERIVGRATSVVLSLDRGHHYAPRWNRFFTAMR